MKKILFAVAVFVISASAAHAVLPITDEDDYYGGGMMHRHFPYHTPAMDSLQNVASGECPPDTCFDGSPILRREGVLAIIKEEQVRENRGRWIGGHGGRGEGSGREYQRPTVTMKQTVGIADRKGYIREERNGGRFTGGLLGLLGVLAFIAGPIVGVAVLAATLTTGIMVGGKKAEAAAEAKPNVFEREQSYEKN